MRVLQCVRKRSSKYFLFRSLCPFWLSIFLLCPTHGQTAAEPLQALIEYGEFPAALKLANQLPYPLRDQAFKDIAAAQWAAGTPAAAYHSAVMIKDDAIRSDWLRKQYEAYGRNFDPTDSSDPRGRPLDRGQWGGITEADFEPLIDLIKSTIDPEGWDDTNGDGTISVYPSGVYADSEGALQRLQVSGKRQLKMLQENIGRHDGNRNPLKQTHHRKVSLNRLEAVVQIQAAQGRGPDSTMQNLAGMYDIDYLVLDPVSDDLLIVGPAGPWKKDSIGRSINVKTGLPTLQLDDLVVCLRNVWDNNGKYGCKITPRQPALVATQHFLATSKLKGKAWRDGLRDTLGRQDIEVFGIDPRTHAGHVLVEADYRMKLIGMGLEDSILEVPSYLARLQTTPGNQSTPMDVVRWWFTMNYDEIITDEHHQAFVFPGKGVMVLSENELLDQAGNRIHTGKSKGPTAGFAKDFTQHFDKLAKQYPIYSELKNLFDLSIVAALIKDQQLNRRTNWNLTYFGNSPTQGNLKYRPRLSKAAHEVNSIMNHRVISYRKQRSTIEHTLVGVSGGVSFDAMKVVDSRRIRADRNPETPPITKPMANPNAPILWWWD